MAKTLKQVRNRAGEGSVGSGVEGRVMQVPEVCEECVR